MDKLVSGCKQTLVHVIPNIFLNNSCIFYSDRNQFTEPEKKLPGSAVMEYSVSNKKESDEYEWKTMKNIYKTFKCEMHGNNDTAKLENQNNIQDRRVKVQEVTNKQKGKQNCKVFWFSYLLMVYSFFCGCLSFLLYFHFHVCEVIKRYDGYKKRMTMMIYEIMTMI